MIFDSTLQIFVSRTEATSLATNHGSPSLTIVLIVAELNINDRLFIVILLLMVDVGE